MKLSLIIERAVQSAYHELIVLAELLPRKPDVERKVSEHEIFPLLFFLVFSAVENASFQKKYFKLLFLFNKFFKMFCI